MFKFLSYKLGGYFTLIQYFLCTTKPVRSPRRVCVCVCKSWGNGKTKRICWKFRPTYNNSSLQFSVISRALILFAGTYAHIKLSKQITVLKQITKFMFICIDKTSSAGAYRSFICDRIQAKDTRTVNCTVLLRCYLYECEGVDCLRDDTYSSLLS